MSNKVSSTNSSNLLDNKLAVLLEDLNQELQQDGTVERELLLSRFNSVINKFYSTLSSPLFKAKDFREGTFVNYTQLNDCFREIGRDINILYREVNSLEKFAVNNFNTLHSQAFSLRGRLRRISSDLGDFKLQANDNLGGATYFSDGFHNTDKIDYEEKLYDETACHIDIKSGIVSLPIVSGSEPIAVSEISVGSGSNGIRGNNQELGGLFRGELKTVIDDSADTWFEYEKVTIESTNVPLILELRFTLDSEEVINTVNVLPTSFATRNYPRITRLETSVDGKEYTSVLDQIPSSVSFEDSQDKVVVLDPASGKFSGETKLKFPPVKAKYISMIIQQDDAYIIKTPSGLKYRKAIGVRGIEFLGEEYEDKGEIVSVNYLTDDEIKKVSILSNEQTTADQTVVRHYVSVDDGQNWNEIQSIEKIGTEIKEILNFNLDAVDSIDTSTPVVRIRHKALLERDPVGFSSRGGVEKRREHQSEFIPFTAGSKNIVLKERPVSDTVVVRNVSFGSVGGNERYLINPSDIVTRDGFGYIYLPDNPFLKNSILEDQEDIYINNERWSRTLDISGEASNAKVYEFDYLNNIIKFGDDNTGKAIDGDIFLGLEREEVGITNDLPRRIRTSFPTDDVTETTKIYRLDQEQTKSGHITAKATNIIRLNLTDVQSITVVADPATSLVAEKTFIDGASELLIAGDYSIDYLNGIIYVFTATAEEDDTILDIDYKPRVSVEDFTFSQDSIEIPEESYVSEVTSDTVVLGALTKVVNLNNTFIEPRSIKFLSPTGTFKTEVPFLGDGSEFDLGLTAVELDGYYTVDYKKGIIYTFSQVSGTIILEYNITNYFAEYNIAAEVPRDAYEIDEDNQQISLTDRYVVKTFSDSIIRTPVRTLFKVEYDFIAELNQNPKELEKFSTPLFKDYALVILTKGQL